MWVLVLRTSVLICPKSWEVQPSSKKNGWCRNTNLGKFSTFVGHVYFPFRMKITSLSLVRQCIILYPLYQLEECQGEEWASMTTDVSFWACLSRNDKEAAFQSSLLDLGFRLKVGDTRQVALSQSLPKSDLECAAVLNNALVAPSLKQQ